ECTITGLTNGTNYSVTVHATNGLGDSDESSSASVTPNVEIWIGTASSYEGDSGTNLLTIPVTLSSPSPNPITVQYNLVDGSAKGAAKPTVGVDDYYNTGKTMTLKFNVSPMTLVTPVYKTI